jgi:hypothetical protein
MHAQHHSCLVLIVFKLNRPSAIPAFFLVKPFMTLLRQWDNLAPLPPTCPGFLSPPNIVVRYFRCGGLRFSPVRRTLRWPRHENTAIASECSGLESAHR